MGEHVTEFRASSFERFQYQEKNLNIQYIERYSAQLLLQVLARKAARRFGLMIGKPNHPDRAVVFNGLTVFDTPVLHGQGLTVGADYPRALLSLGLTKVPHIFEFCAGPGYIGYSLLANGFCDRLTLADINPAAVAMARKTARFNGLDDLVSVYQSDALDQIPGDRKWDLVVGNPPHVLPMSEDQTNIRAYDKDWNVHRRFYAAVKPFMKPGGLVIMQENGHHSTDADYLPMIAAGGGEFVSSFREQDICGHSNGMYYMVSRW